MLLNTVKSTLRNRGTIGRTFRGISLAMGLLVSSYVPLSAETPSTAIPHEAMKPTVSVSSTPWPAFDHATTSAAFGRDLFSDAPTERRTRDPDWLATETLLQTSAAADDPSKPGNIQLRLSHRYRNPLTARFASSVSGQQALSFYWESMRLIDSRHLNPSTYAVRTKQAMTNLIYAVETPAFLEAYRLSPSERQVELFRNSMQTLMAKSSPRTAGEALNVLYGTIDLAGRQLGLPAAPVVMEFVYGATESLDKYSSFVPQEPAPQPSAGLEDHVVGIGVQIKPHDDGVVVVSPLRGGPAAEAGLLPGDLIVSVNGRKLSGKSLDYAADLIGGPVGTPVLLGIVRDEQPVRLFTLSRRRVEIHSVSQSRMIGADEKVGYIKLDQFAKNSSREMDEALWELYRQGMQSLVIDVRGNPGGLLTTAIELSNKFLPCGQIVSTRGRNASDNTAENATYARTWKIPLVVLIDNNSASASEIFAAAIQDNERGIVVGRHSYGKGTVQTHFPLQTVGGNLKLTTAKFYSPNGRVMAGAGVEPDVPVELPSDSESSISVDVDIDAAIAVAKTNRLKDMATAKARCHDPKHHALPL